MATAEDMESASSIVFDECLSSVDAHPHTALLVASTMMGDLSLYSYSPDHHGHHGNSCDGNGWDAAKLMKTVNISKEPIRCGLFSKSGKDILCVGLDKHLRIVDSETLHVKYDMESAHAAPINVSHCISERLMATGDEEGVIKLWDVRSKHNLLTVNQNTDFISDMKSITERSALLCSSGDGSLSVLNLKQCKFEERSDCSESELLCVTAVKGSSKVICGDGRGVLGIFNWGLWGDVVDRYPIASEDVSVDACVAISNSVVVCGGMDGILRPVQILPNKVMGEVGHHESEHPIQSLCISHDGSTLISGSYDCIKFWPTEDIPRVWVEEEGDRSLKGTRHKKKRKRRHLLEYSEKPIKKRNNFFDDL